MSLWKVLRGQLCRSGSYEGVAPAKEAPRLRHVSWYVVAAWRVWSPRCTAMVLDTHILGDAGTGVMVKQHAVRNLQSCRNSIMVD